METKQLASRIITRLVLVCATLVVVMLGVQSVILATIGTAGPEISRTREETKQTQVDNEVLKAKIRELQTSAQVTDTIENELGMRQADLIRLESPIDSTNAVALVD